MDDNGKSINTTEIYEYLDESELEENEQKSIF